MEKWEKARNLLEQKVKAASIEDDVNMLAFEKVKTLIGEVEKELGPIDEESDGECWFDDSLEDSLYEIYDKIRAFMNNEETM